MTTIRTRERSLNCYTLLMMSSNWYIFLLFLLSFIHTPVLSSPCSKGQGLSNGRCIDCPAAKWCALWDGSINSCRPGTVSAGGATRDLPPYFTFIDTGKVIPSGRVLEPISNWRTEAGPTACTYCPIGLVPSGDFSRCVQCPKNTFNEPEILTIEGKTSYGMFGSALASIGGTSNTFCTHCMAGFYQPNEGKMVPPDAINPWYSITIPAPDSTDPVYDSNGQAIAPRPLTFSDIVVPDGFCLPCEVGKYRTSTMDSCQACPAGTFSGPDYNQFNDYTDLSYRIAISGIYQSGLNLHGVLAVRDPRGNYGFVKIGGGNSAEDCMPCPIGTSSVTGQKYSNDCTPCLPGYYGLETMDPSTNQRTRSCVQCQAGSYAESSKTDVCTLCPAGTFSNVVGSASSSVCTDCPAGYVSKPGSTECSPCSPGTYAPNPRSTECIVSPKGTYVDTYGASDPIPCLPGMYSPSVNSTACLPCFAGSYQPNARSEDCVLCVRGLYSTAINQTSNTTCLQCPPGTASAMLGAFSPSFCSDCNPGFYSSNPGTVYCSESQPGSFVANAGQNASSLCAEGTYSDEIAMSSCLSCPPGSYSENKGSSACALCDAGTYSNLTGAISPMNCTSCPVATYSPSPGSIFCTLCPAGSYASTIGNAKCSKCSPGTASSIVGASSSSSCLPCTAGDYSFSGFASCEPCWAGSYSSDNGAGMCTACPEGTFSTAVRSTSAASCQSCPPNTYSFGSASCATCPDGTTLRSASLGCQPSMPANVPAPDFYFSGTQVEGLAAMQVINNPSSVSFVTDVNGVPGAAVNFSSRAFAALTPSASGALSTVLPFGDAGNATLSAFVQCLPESPLSTVVQWGSGDNSLFLTAASRTLAPSTRFNPATTVIAAAPQGVEWACVNYAVSEKKVYICDDNFYPSRKVKVLDLIQASGTFTQIISRDYTQWYSSLTFNKLRTTGIHHSMGVYDFTTSPPTRICMTDYVGINGNFDQCTTFAKQLIPRASSNGQGNLWNSNTHAFHPITGDYYFSIGDYILHYPAPVQWSSVGAQPWPIVFNLKNLANFFHPSFQLVFSFSGKYAYLVTYNGCLYLYKFLVANNGGLSVLPSFTPFNVDDCMSGYGSVAPSNDDKFLYVTNGHDYIYVLDANTGDVIEKVDYLGLHFAGDIYTTPDSAEVFLFHATQTNQYGSPTDGYQLLRIDKPANKYFFCDGMWHHVAKTYDAVTEMESFYIDGVEIETSSHASFKRRRLSGNGLAFPGKGNSSLTLGWNGNLDFDDARIFSGAISNFSLYADVLNSTQLLAISSPSIPAIPHTVTSNATDPSKGMYFWLCESGYFGPILTLSKNASVADGRWMFSISNGSTWPINSPPLSVCAPCSPGSYSSDPGNTQCTLCESGSYSSTVGRSTPCDLCAIGTFSAVSGAAAPSSCIACPLNYYSNTSGSAQCTSCASGSQTLSIGSSSCTLCNAGTYSNSTTNGICIPCEAGTYSMNSGASSCDGKCPVGTSSSTSGATSSAVCLACPPGKISIAGSSTCTPCNAGYFSTDGVTCTRCASGTSSDVGSAECYGCDRGTFSNSLSTAVTCRPCYTGTYSANVNATACTPCSPGNFLNETGGTACQTCPPGSWSSTYGSSVCTECPKGFYGTGNSPCVACPVGYFSSFLGADKCFPAPPGFYVETSAALAPTSCPAGNFTATNASVFCPPCEPGSFSEGADPACTLASPGFFVPTAGAIEQLICPAGSYTGSNGQSQCTLCAPGSFAPNNATSDCTLASPGFFVPTAGAIEQLICPAGSYTGSNGQSQCTLCAPGSFASNTATSACTLSAPGYYTSTSGSTQDVTCPSNTYSPISGLSYCIPCPINGNYASTNQTGATKCTCSSGNAWDRYLEVCKPKPTAETVIFSYAFTSSLFCVSSATIANLTGIILDSATGFASSLRISVSSVIGYNPAAATIVSISLCNQTFLVVPSNHSINNLVLPNKSPPIPMGNLPGRRSLIVAPIAMEMTSLSDQIIVNMGISIPQLLVDPIVDFLNGVTANVPSSELSLLARVVTETFENASAGSIAVTGSTEQGNGLSNTLSEYFLAVARSATNISWNSASALFHSISHGAAPSLPALLAALNLPPNSTNISLPVLQSVFHGSFVYAALVVLPPTDEESLSKGSVAAIVVCLLLGALAFCCWCFIGARRRRREKDAKETQPSSATSAVMIIDTFKPMSGNGNNSNMGITKAQNPMDRRQLSIRKPYEVSVQANDLPSSAPIGAAALSSSSSSV